MSNADLPAMPSGVLQDCHNAGNYPLNLGLTKREELSARFMAVWIPLYAGEGFDHNEVARIAIDSANALIEEWEK